MNLNTNNKPTYQDVVIVAEFLMKMTNNPTFIFETDAGCYTVHPAPRYADAFLKALEVCKSPKLVQTIPFRARRKRDSISAAR